MSTGERLRLLRNRKGYSQVKVQMLTGIDQSDYSKIELDDKGEIKDAKDLMKSIKEEWPEHVAKKETKGAETPNPPEGGNGGSGYSDIRAMTAKWHAAKYGEVPKSKSAADGGNE